MPVLKPRKIKTQPEKAFIFYNFETIQENNYKKGDKLHEVILCVAQCVCDDCFNSDMKSVCPTCGGGETCVFEENPLETFVNFAIKKERPRNIKK